MSSSTAKVFDTVKMMRDARDVISARITSMTVQEQNEWLRANPPTDPTLLRLFKLAAQHLSALRESRAQIFSVRSSSEAQASEVQARPLNQRPIAFSISAVFVSSAGPRRGRWTQHLWRLSRRVATGEGRAALAA